MKDPDIHDSRLSYARIGENPAIQFIWAHGWGQNHSALLPLARPLKAMGSHYVLDLPGFGQSARPAATWGTKDYARHLAAWLKTLPPGKRIWVGHSFGCRVGIQLAAVYPDLVNALFLIGAAGLPRKRTPAQKIRLTVRIYAYKLLRGILISLGISHAWLAARFGSSDYRNAGEMRDILMTVIREDLTDIAPRVSCPVHLIYGENDTQTAPEAGERYVRLMTDSQLTILPMHDHYSVLSDGRHQILAHLKTFARRVIEND
uniref:Pimeloyl-ACP methyl ester carboxylesterase n=1 Tax=Candidatus Kentrum sp. SD TaxID=2126332 RepID=A0A450Y8G6_9GAMM|nr:MAG: Pimeloyl-ACP methyl ester carboxylesterase [Candidatus Kentron sp. SD]VFK42492.1 MAG: Pimeloyl-ACP methyl ester carboxylesterase [Candidatus Kentron sp. SD]VFK78153.1 MAG: Pimeloyl-ACP methyl ester carboxylesterase [Candidatus Kentron sp. SD]